jgi:hypothetical protein
MGGMAPGTAVKPQIGQSPAQLMITGFYHSVAKNIQPYPEYTVFAGGEIFNGPGAHSWDSIPVVTVNDEVAELKATLISALTTAFPVGIPFSIFRIDYSGIVYGDRGYTFPR